MLVNMYSIKDKLIGFYQPMTDANDDSAIRNFVDSFKNSTGSMRYNPEDFELYSIGKFDTDCGVIIDNVPVLLFKGSELNG